MKMKLLLILLLFNLPTFGQFKDYAKLVNEAELLICNERFEYALEHYHKAFQLNHNPFGKDVYNAWVCSYILNDTNSFKSLSIYLIKHGAFLQDHTHEDLLSSVVDRQNLKLFSNIWLQLKSTTKNEIDMDYHNQLVALLEADRNVRKYFIKEYPNKNYNVVGRDSLNIFDSLNVVGLKQLITEKGFPTENLIGYDMNSPGNAPIYSIVLSHDKSWTNRKTLDTILYQNVLLGNFPGEIYATLKDQGYNMDPQTDSNSFYQQEPFSRYGTESFYTYKDSIYITKIKPQTLSPINKARAHIGLGSFEDQITKGVYQYTHPYFKFSINPFFYFNLDLGFEDIVQVVKDNAYNKNEINDFNSIRMRGCEYGLRH